MDLTCDSIFSHVFNGTDLQVNKSVLRLAIWMERIYLLEVGIRAEM